MNKLLVKILVAVLLLAALLAVAYALGPQQPPPQLPAILPKLGKPLPDLPQLAENIAQAEKQLPVKPGNQARIVWQDPENPQKTPYSVVYLHGFSASQKEGDPTHLEFAKRYGCNLYLSRLAGHGLNVTEQFADLTAGKLLQSALEAVNIGRMIGDKVILISCSTGSTLALPIAAANPNIVEAVIMYSPNIAVKDPKAKILGQPWGLQIARLVSGGNTREFPADEEFKKYWTSRYRLEGAVAMQTLIDYTMQPEVFEAVRQPVFMGYYYKSETEQDDVVSVPAMLAMFGQLGTPADQKRSVAFPNAKAHIIASPIRSKDVAGVQAATHRFAEEVLGLQPAN